MCSVTWLAAGSACDPTEGLMPFPEGPVPGKSLAGGTSRREYQWLAG